MEINREEELFDSLVLELRRGIIVLGVLSQLKKPQYGYSLVVSLEEKGMAVDAGTLYPLLRRLEKQEILRSSWDTEGTKPRKYYEMSELGSRVFEKLCGHWSDTVKTMERFINKEDS